MQNNIDDINKEEATPFISFEKAWAGLKPELDAEAARRGKRKRRVIFFWFTSITIGLGIGVYVFENNKTNNLVAQQNVEINNDNSKQKSTSDKKLNVVDEAKKESIKNAETTFVADSKSSSNVVVLSNQTQTMQQNVSVLKTKITAVSSKKNRAAKDVNDIARHSIKIKSSNAKAIDKSNNNSLKVSKASHQKNNQNTFETITNATNNVEKSIAQTSTLNSIVVAANSTDSTKKLVDTSPAKSSIANTSTNKTKKAEEKKSNAIHYGLQWNLPAQNGVNFLDVNSVNQPATLLIPQLLVSKQLGKKHSLVLAFNPYSQYYLNNKAVVDFAKYNVVIYSASQSNTTKPEEITYTEATAFNKLISVEASLSYQYQISSKIKVGLGVSNSWVQAALMQNKVIKNASLITRDSLYGIDKTDKDWSYLQTSFLLGKLDIQYNIKKFDIGICFSKPISSPFDNSQYKTPINTNLFVRWMIK